MKLQAHAKINLSLDILGRREDGYHDLSMVMLSVSLCDELTLTLTPPGVSFACSDPSVPDGESNTACRAASLFLHHTGLAKRTGVRITLDKRIPSQAGLGGGSADAAAVLHGLNELTGAALSRQELLSLGLRVGPDVPFCLEGGIRLVGGVGETLSPAPPMISCFLVISKPPVGVSTPDAFRRADARTDGGHDYTGAVLRALETEDLASLGAAIGNDFEDVTRLPEVERIKSLLLEAGAAGARMTGSGPAVFGLFADEGAARRCADHLKHEYPQTFFCVPA